MILADTSVVIAYWKKPSPEMAVVFARMDVCICGVVIAELLHGARSPQESAEMERRARILPAVALEETIWPKVGRNLQALRTAGLPMPFQDVVLATLAMQRRMQVWTLDGHYHKMQAVLADLELFSPD